MSFVSARLIRHARRMAALSVAAALLTVHSLPALPARDLIDGDLPIAPGGIDPQAMAGKDAQEGVFVRDSALAVEKFALAQKMERLKEWDKAADLYQEILEKYADRVVPSQLDAEGKIYQYTSVVKGVQDQLAKWPPQGRDVYRAMYETDAQAMLDGARQDDLFTLNQVVSKYFITEAAKSAGSRLLDLNLERGEFIAAARMGDQLIERHPGVNTERAGLLYRTALAYHVAGDTRRAEERLARLKRDHPQDLGTVRGKEVVLATSLAEELKARPSIAMSGTSADSHRTFGGDETRGRISPAEGRPGAKLYSVPLLKPDWQNINPQQRDQLENSTNNTMRSSSVLGVMPATDRGELFFQDGRHVYAVSLESGVPLPGWAQTYAQKNGRYSVPGSWGSARTNQLTVTLTDESVLAVLGQPDRQAFMVGIQPQGESRLVCLDRVTGAENWSVAPSTLELPKESAAVKELQVTGSPLVIGDNVLITARTNKMGQQFEDCWVLCFNLADGKYRWSCYIASSSTPGAMFGMQQLTAAENSGHLSYADGRVYVMTNLGALAALDAYSGTIIWLNIYPRGNQPFNGNVRNPFFQQQTQQAPAKPWAANPVIVRDGKLFMLPGESKHLFVYDAGSGVELKRIRLDHLGDADTLLGVMGDRLIVNGNKTVVCLNWQKYDAENFNDEMLFWRAGELAFPIRGRGFVTRDAVFVPTEAKLFWFDMRTGRAIDTYPPYRSGRLWTDPDSTEGPGNVLVTSDHVVIAGATQVDVYTDLEAARKKLDREVAAAPRDPQPRLRYAEVMFVSGDPAAAMAKLDEAIELLGGLNAMAKGPARDRVFNDALTFAQKAANETPEGENNWPVLFFDRAAAAAANPQQHVHYRLARARFLQNTGEADAAARLYQEILSEPQFRTVALLEERTGGPTQAAMVAEQAIGELIKQFGPQIFKPFQQEAEAALATAQASKTPDQLLAVAEKYPNATVAPRAMLLAADAYEAADDPRHAIRVLRQMYFKYPTSAEKPLIIESMARNYLALPNRVDVAAARLAQGAALPGDLKLQKPLKLPNGRELARGTPFTEALEEIRKVRSEAAGKSLPDFGLPVPPRDETREAQRARIKSVRTREPRTIAEGIDALLQPLRDFGRSDRVVAWSSTDGLTFYSSADGKALGASNAFSETPAGIAWTGDEAVLWGDSQVALLRDGGGAAVWSIDLKALPALEVVKAGDTQPQPPRRGINDAQLMIRGNRRFIVRGGNVQQLGQPPAVAQKPAADAPEQVVEARPVGERVLVWTTTGRLLSVEIADGRIAWQTRLADRAFDRLVATEDFTAIKTSDDSLHRILVIDTDSGQVRGTKAFNPQTGLVPVNLALAADGTLVYTLPDRLVLKDLYKPWTERENEVPAAAGQPPYTGATAPDHLLIAEGRILALADSSNSNPALTANEKYVRVHSLETGQPLPLRYRSPEGDKEVDRVLTAGHKNWDVSLRVVGPRLYVVGPQTVISYNLDRPAETWKGTIDTIDPQTPPNIRDAFIGQDYLVLLDEPSDLNAAAGAPPVPGAGNRPAKVSLSRLHAYARYPASEQNPGESGRLDYIKDLSEPAGFTGAWQAVEGGFYFLTADGKLQMLPGSAG